MIAFFARVKEARIKKLEEELRHARKQISLATRDYRNYCLRYSETRKPASRKNAEECACIIQFWEKRLARLEHKLDPLGTVTTHEVSIPRLTHYG